MEPSRGGFKPRGSFGVPPEMMKELEQARKAPPAEPPAAAPVTRMAEPEAQPPAATPAPAPVQEVDREKAFAEAREKLEAFLGTKITAEDIKEYVFKGSLTKEVDIIPGVLKGTFKTLTPTEYLEVDQREAQFRDEGKYTIDGIMNQKAVVNLSYAWIAAAGKPLSAKNDPAIREQHIRKLGAHVVEAAVTANQELNTLLRLMLSEKSFIKKS